MSADALRALADAFAILDQVVVDAGAPGDDSRITPIDRERWLADIAGEWEGHHVFRAG